MPGETAQTNVCNAKSSNFQANGDDSIELHRVLKDGQTAVIDAFGEKGARFTWAVCGGRMGGPDNTLVRTPRVARGQPRWLASAGTTCSNCEWLGQPKDYWDNGGQALVCATLWQARPRCA